MRWRTKAGDEISASLGTPMTKDQVAQAWRTALDPKGEWIGSVLAAADKRLTEVRRGVPDAGGLVIASNQTQARAYAAHLRALTGEPPAVVLSDDRGRLPAHRGVRCRDVALDGGRPDGVRGCRRTAAQRRRLRHVDLHPALLRPGGGSIRPGPEAWRDGLRVPPVRARRPRPCGAARGATRPCPRPEACAEGDIAAMWAEEQGLLDEATREEKASAGLLDEGAFEALESDAHFDHVLFDKQQWGMHAQVGSEDEEEYLGLPGLLEPDQVAALLHERQTQAGEEVAQGPRARRCPSPRTGRSQLSARSSTSSSLPTRGRRACRTPPSTWTCGGRVVGPTSRQPRPSRSRSGSKDPPLAGRPSLTVQSADARPSPKLATSGTFCHAPSAAVAHLRLGSTRRSTSQAGEGDDHQRHAR